MAQIDLIGVASGEGSGAATVRATSLIAGAALATAMLVGAVTTQPSTLGAAAAGSGVATGALRATKPLSGASTASGVAVGALPVTHFAQGAARGTGRPVGSLTGGWGAEPLAVVARLLLGDLAHSLAWAGNVLPVAYTDVIPSGAPPGGRGVAFHSNGTVYVWSGSAWVAGTPDLSGYLKRDGSNAPTADIKWPVGTGPVHVRDKAGTNHKVRLDPFWDAGAGVWALDFIDLGVA